MKLTDSVALVTGANRGLGANLVTELRAELRTRGISMLGAYPSGIDTDMLAAVGGPKAPPRLVASRIVAALAAGDSVAFPDDASAVAGAIYLSDPLKLEQILAAD